MAWPHAICMMRGVIRKARLPFSCEQAEKVVSKGSASWRGCGGEEKGHSSSFATSLRQARVGRRRTEQGSELPLAKCRCAVGLWLMGQGRLQYGEQPSDDSCNFLEQQLASLDPTPDRTRRQLATSGSTHAFRGSLASNRSPAAIRFTQTAQPERLEAALAAAQPQRRCRPAISATRRWQRPRRPQQTQRRRLPESLWLPSRGSYSPEPAARGPDESPTGCLIAHPFYPGAFRHIPAAVHPPGPCRCFAQALCHVGRLLALFGLQDTNTQALMLARQLQLDFHEVTRQCWLWQMDEFL